MKASSYPLVTVEDASRTVLDHTPVLPAESVRLEHCFGRVLAEDLISGVSLPSFPASAVDGYAVRSSDGGGRLRVIGESAAGRPFKGRLESGTAARLLTGGVLPEGADSVVMVEDTSLDGEWVTVARDGGGGGELPSPG